ncbi:stbA family protein [Escherichia coli BCE030_MS-09]|nr:stbA family protein [Escherichia coli BCE030_MS-09]
MKICIDDGSTNIKLAWTENGERRNAISPNSFKSEWSAPFGGTQPANYMLDGVRYGFDPVSDRFVQTTDTQYQYSDVNVLPFITRWSNQASHHRRWMWLSPCH